MIYGGKDLATAFKGVRGNTITIAEEIPADQYDFRAAPEMMSVAEQLAHMAANTDWMIRLHTARLTFVDFAYFQQRIAEASAVQAALVSGGKDAILAALRTEGDAFVTFLESLSDETLEQAVSFPPPVQPSTKSRFEMLMSAKEHEMHHRGQLMVYQRVLGMVPHLTRRRAAFAAGASTTTGQPN
jgi:uncharacterized damage-inducible protein DinB